MVEFCGKYIMYNIRLVVKLVGNIYDLNNMNFFIIDDSVIVIIECLNCYR